MFQQMSTILSLAVVALALASQAQAEDKPRGRSKMFEFDANFAAKVQAIKASVGAGDNAISQHTRRLIETLNSAADLDLQKLRRELVGGITTSIGGVYPPSYGPVYPPSYGAGSQTPPSGVIEPTTQTPKAFELTLQADYNAIAAQLAAFTVDTQNAIAARLNLNAQRVVITRVAPGSVIVDFQVLIDNTFSSSEVTNIVTSIVGAPAAIFPASYTTKYGVSSVAAALVNDPAISPSPASNPSPNPSSTSPEPSTNPSTSSPSPSTQPSTTSPTPNPNSGVSPTPSPVMLGASKATAGMLVSVAATLAAILLASML